EVDAAVLPVSVRDRGLKRDLAFDLFGVEVRGSASVLDASEPRRHSHRLEQRRHDRCFPATSVSYQCDVSNLSALESLHDTSTEGAVFWRLRCVAAWANDLRPRVRRQRLNWRSSQAVRPKIENECGSAPGRLSPSIRTASPSPCTAAASRD